MTNARHGLAIQVTHRCGLVPRLALVDAQPPDRLAPEHRVKLMAKLAEM